MEPNCVHYLVYFDDAPSPDDSTLLETRKEEVHEFSNWIVQRKLMDKKNAAPLTQAEHPPRGEDDEELDAIGKSYGSGQGPYWNTAAVKERLS